MDYKIKYLKYKSKYINLKSQINQNAGGIDEVNDVINIIIKVNKILRNPQYFNFNSLENVNDIFTRISKEELMIYYLFNYNNMVIGIDVDDGRFKKIIKNINSIVKTCNKIYKNIISNYMEGKINYLLIPGDSPKYIIDILALNENDMSKFKIITFPVSQMSRANAYYTGRNVIEDPGKEKYDTEFIKYYMLNYFKIPIEDIVDQNIIVMDISYSGDSRQYITSLIKNDFGIDVKYVNIDEFLEKKNEIDHIMTKIFYFERKYMRAQYMLPCVIKNNNYKYSTFDFIEQHKLDNSITFDSYMQKKISDDVELSKIYNYCFLNYNLMLLYFKLYFSLRGDEFTGLIHKIMTDMFPNPDEFNGKEVILYNYNKNTPMNNKLTYDLKTREIDISNIKVKKVIFNEQEYNLLDIYKVYKN